MTSAFEGPDYRPTELVDVRGVAVAARFAAAASEYVTATTAAGVVDRSDRGLLRLTGRDRKAWLHNLVTNAVKTLDDHAGNYAFAADVRGRVQFDLNVLARPDELWLDIDAGTAARAAQYFDRYLITEDVKIEDCTAAFARLGVTGPTAGAAAARLGVGNLAALPALASVPLSDGAWLFRHDFCGAVGFEVVLPRALASAWWSRLVGEWSLPAIGWHTVDVLRIEAGIPWLGHDLDEKTLPPETGQVERGISYHKGCYLGQEVIERMRSFGSLARRLTRVTVDGAAVPALPAPITRDGADAGRLTSLATHPTRGVLVGLAYLRTSLKDFDGLTVGTPPQAVRVVA